MYRVNRFELVRRAVLVDGMSRREAARQFGIHRRTVSKMLEYALPPGYRSKEPRKKPKIGLFLTKIEEILKQDESAPRKQRHTGQRIYERLRDEFGYEGGPWQVCRAIRVIKDKPKEAFVPLVSIPGEAQADFGESVVEIDGIRRKAHAFVMVLPFSGVWFMCMYPSENAESFCDGHVRAFRSFGGTPRRSIYDNPGYAVDCQGASLTGRERVLRQMFAELRSACLFEAVFANPRSGNEKGSVERKVATTRSSLMVPVPKATSFEELNERLLQKALQFKQNCELFAQDRAALLPLADYEPCRLVLAKADKLCLVCFEGSRYSVPTRYAQRSVMIRATPFKIEIVSTKEVVATHERSLVKDGVSAPIEHYIDLLEQKPRAVRTALPVIKAGLPDVFELFRRKAEDGTSAGDLRFVAVLRMLGEFGVEPLAAALQKALAQSIIEPSDIRLLVLKETERLPPNLCIECRLPDGRKTPRVDRPPLAEYGHLLAGAAR